MPFNSNTYHANKFARRSRELLAQARDAKAAELRGEPHWLESLRSPFLAKSALTYSRLARAYRWLAELERGRHV